MNKPIIPHKLLTGCKITKAIQHLYFGKITSHCNSFSFSNGSDTIKAPALSHDFQLFRHHDINTKFPSVKFKWKTTTNYNTFETAFQSPIKFRLPHRLLSHRGHLAHKNSSHILYQLTSNGLFTLHGTRNGTWERGTMGFYILHLHYVLYILRRDRRQGQGQLTIVFHCVHPSPCPCLCPVPGPVAVCMSHYAHSISIHLFICDPSPNIPYFFYTDIYV